VKNINYINGLMMSIPSLYKAIAASEMGDEIMNDFSTAEISDVIEQRV
jgi:hypothetical protein